MTSQDQLSTVKYMPARWAHVLYKKKVDRKEFLMYLGYFLLAILGISHIQKTLENIGKKEQPQGFGSGKYGR